MNMIAFLFSFIVAASAFANDPIPAGCTASPNFSAEAYTVWASEGVSQTVSADSTQSPTIAVGQRVELQLLPTENEFGGFVNFEIPVSGTYVIATDAYPRMDLTDLSSGENLDPADFGKIRDCGTVSKALRFEFAKPGSFALGFISRQSPMLNVLIWRLN